MRHLMNPLDFSVEELDRLFETARDIESNMTKYEMCIRDRYTTGRFLGIFGEPRVNVLKVNLALEGIL